MFLLGYEKVRLCAYHSLRQLSIHKGAGFVKTMVLDLGQFVKRESTRGNELFHHVCGRLDFDPMAAPDFRRFYIAVGHMMLSGDEAHVQRVARDLLNMYLERTGIESETPLGPLEKKVLKVAASYYKTCKINYRSLYDPVIKRRAITIGEHRMIIDLPPLPQISSKELLAKALSHKELYTVFTLPEHAMYDNLVRKKITEIQSLAQVIRYDLLFLDGLGDLFIAAESCEFLYEFKLLHPYADDDTFGKKTFTFLKTVLGTNTLLSRLAVEYNLHTALEDPAIVSTLQEGFIPFSYRNLRSTDKSQRRYEEEFVADYFEQYVGALFLEQPQAAKEWLRSLFESILLLISDTYRVTKKQRVLQHDYRAWGADMIGRRL